MIRPLFFVFLMCFSLVISGGAFSMQDKNCNYGELKIEFIQSNTSKNSTINTVRIYGILDTPNPGYVSSFSMNEGTEGQIVNGTLSLYMKDEGLMSAAVITPITIDKTVEVPANARTIFIDVSKKFNWGPEYFMGGFSGSQTLCLPPSTYK